MRSLGKGANQFSSRLFYLFQGPKTSWIKEGSLFHCLFWFCPLASVTVALMEWVEALYHVEDPLMVFYSFCARTPFPLEVVHESVFLKLYVIGAVLSHFVELGIYAAILVKQSKIESSASSVYIVKDNRCVSGRRHQRNVVSAVGHFASCVVSVVVTLTILAPPAFMIVTSGPSGPPLVCDLIVFSFPSINFFVYPLIETMCTAGNLRDNLFTLACWKSLFCCSGEEKATLSFEFQIITRSQSALEVEGAEGVGDTEL